MISKVSDLAAKISVLGFLFLAVLYVFRPTISIPLELPKHQEGRAYYAKLPSFSYWFSAPENRKSLFKDNVLLEGDSEVGPPKSLHSDIRTMGGGRWSYWGSVVYFSPSESSEVSTIADTQYTLRARFDPPLEAVAYLCTVLLFLLAPYLAGRCRELNFSARPRQLWPAIDLEYSPEIDGLRGLAVLLVVFYHFDVSNLSGGFVGVDVFFVISGYLITKIICSDLAAGRFSFSYFYFRRAKRIFPALIVVSIATSIFAAIFLNPTYFLDYALSLVAASLFSANLYFYSQGGYFDFDAITKPLLHTWSLGVEEHFYLLFPFLLFLAHRWLSFAGAAIGVLLLGVGSLGAGHWLLGFDEPGAFFISPFRFYEFTIGASLVFLKRYAFPGALLNLLALIGFALVVSPALLYGDATIFPGLAALPVCVGTALLLFCRRATIVSKILGSRMAVSLGLISYSLYLVHWPLAVFYKSVRLTTLPFSLSEQVSLIVVTITLAYIVYRYVETPCRHFKHGQYYWKIKASLVSFLVALLPTALAGLFLYSIDGWPQRFPEEMRRQLSVPLEVHHKYVWARFNERLGETFSDDGGRKILLVGDSQAADFLNVLDQITKNSWNVSTFLTPVNCQSVIPRTSEFYNLISADDSQVKECEQRHKMLATDNRVREAETVIFASSWRDYGIDEIANTFETVSKINPDAKIVFIGPKTQSKGGVDLMSLARWSEESIGELAYSLRAPQLWGVRDRFMQVTVNMNRIDLLGHICDESAKQCSVYSDDGLVMFSDKSHLTKSGSIALARRLQDANEFRALY